MRNALNETVCLEHLRASKYYRIRNKTPETPIFNTVNIATLQSFFCLSILALFIVIFEESPPRTFTVRSYVELSLCAFDIFLRLAAYFSSDIFPLNLSLNNMDTE